MIELCGKRFGRWTVMAYAGASRWTCRCDCGTEKAVDGQSLRRGASTSCGCLRAELQSEAKRGQITNYRHGGSPSSGASPEYRAWAKMKDRCFNQNCVEFFRYGARGITVCERWSGSHSFPAFLEDMGARPARGYSIDRIDNDGDYTPDNCRWATQSEQNANRRPFTRSK